MGIAVSVAASAIASADTLVTYNFSVGPSSTDLTNVTTTVPSFDPGVGGVPVGATLVSYTIHAQSTTSSIISVTNTSLVPFEAGTNVTELSLLGFNIGAPLALDPTKTQFTNNLAVSNNHGSGPPRMAPTLNVSGLAPGDTIGPTLINDSDSFDIVVTCGACSAVKTPPATDPILLYFSTYSTQAQLLNGANSTTTYITVAKVTGTITYDYTTASTQTPEPETMAILGGGLLFCGLLRKRAKR